MFDKSKLGTQLSKLTDYIDLVNGGKGEALFICPKDTPQNIIDYAASKIGNKNVLPILTE